MYKNTVMEMMKKITASKAKVGKGLFALFKFFT